MVKLISGSIAALSLLLVPIPRVSQEQVDALAVLKKAGETYRSLKSCHFEGMIVVEMKSEGMQTRFEAPIVFAVSKPDKMRVEIKNPMLGQATVSDGQTTWRYAPMLRQYTKKAVAATVTPDTDSSGFSPLGFGIPVDFAVADEHIAEDVKEARLLREEPVIVEGSSIDCYVIEALLDSPAKAAVSGSRTFWIDKARHIVLRTIFSIKLEDSPFGGSMEVTATKTLAIAKLNEPLPDSLFIFTPPEKAKEVAEIRGLGMEAANLAGKKAADFTLGDLDGKQVALSSLRGRVVLLNFWASWCGPCRTELPHIEKLHRELRGQGLSVVGINDEDVETVRRFMKEEGFTFTTVLDDQGQTAELYEVSSIPQVFVIGRDGKIVVHYIGARSESDLRAALEKAGIGKAKARGRARQR